MTAVNSNDGVCMKGSSHSILEGRQWWEGSENFRVILGGATRQQQVFYLFIVNKCDYFIFPLFEHMLSSLYNICYVHLYLVLFSKIDDMCDSLCLENVLIGVRSLINSIQIDSVSLNNKLIAY